MFLYLHIICHLYIIGRIELDSSLGMADPNHNGKLRLCDIYTILSNVEKPTDIFKLFQAKFKITVQFRFWVQIGWCPFCATLISQGFGPEVLVEFSNTALRHPRCPVHTSIVACISRS
jgi:hypothetical protein